MSDTTSEGAGHASSDATPGRYAMMEGDIPAAADVALEDINPIAPRLFSENRWQEYFERLREEILVGDL